MHRRCYGVGAKAYEDYGGRGISICEEWGNYEAFREWALLSGYKDNLTIDRIDNNGNYCPENCRWATAKQQANNRRSNHSVKYMGGTHTVSEWADILGLDQRELWQILNRNNWDMSQIAKKVVV